MKVWHIFKHAVFTWSAAALQAIIPKHDMYVIVQQTDPWRHVQGTCTIPNCTFAHGEALMLQRPVFEIAGATSRRVHSFMSNLCMQQQRAHCCTNHDLGEHELRQAPPGYIAKNGCQQLAQPSARQRAPLPSQYAPLPVFGSRNSQLRPDTWLPPPPTQGNAMSRCEGIQGWRTQES